MENAKVLPKGQITIPIGIRKKLNIKTGDIVYLEDTKNGVIIRKGQTLFDVAGSIELKKEIADKELIKKARKKIGENNA